MSSLSIDPNVQRTGQSLLKGALELRSRAFKALLCLLGIFLCLLPFADQVFQIVAQPIMAAMPEDSSLISKEVASPFLTPLKATFWVALFAAMPLLLYHLWKLLDAWLPASKRRVALPFIAASAGLFYVGVAFAFFFVLPMVFQFFATTAPAGVKVMTDINAFLSFTLGMVFAFGLAFQVPIVDHHHRLDRARIAQDAEGSAAVRVPRRVRDRHAADAARRVLADAARAADVRALRGRVVDLRTVPADRE